MGWRFRKRLRIGPGIHLNVGKRGISSVSLGGGGATVSEGKRSTRTTHSIPGTGLSWTATSRRDRKKSDGSQQPGAFEEVRASEPPRLSRPRGKAILLALLAVVCAVWLAAVLGSAGSQFWMVAHSSYPSAGAWGEAIGCVLGALLVRVFIPALGLRFCWNRWRAQQA